MFEEKLLYFFKNNLGYWNLIGKHYWLRFFFYFCGLLLMFFTKNYQWLFIIHVAILVISLFWLAISTWKYAKNTYDAIYPKDNWDIFLCSVIDVYLKNHKIYTINENGTNEALIHLINRLEKKRTNAIQNSPFKYISSSVAFVLLLFIPIWSSLFTWRFQHVESPKEALLILSIFPLTIFFFTLLFKWLFLQNFKEILGFFTSEADRIASLVDKLEMIKFSMVHESFREEIDEYKKRKKKVINQIINDFNRKYDNPNPSQKIFFRPKKKNLKNNKK
ncbi:hypothetical protein QUF84_14755 [Fictibacillus enclensis]|uniref:hypothetical protein n=1 Tax=Fictibacillus enclensis TaxID=1017270 RepID=UPI0025A0E360|nr:hypothetical protein [Fictibacillus enclensis]MDM5338474.1 hypothetical protein [Fictibacillus enclensis]